MHNNDWNFNHVQTVDNANQEPSPAEMIVDIRNLAWDAITEGFMDRKAIIAQTIDFLADDYNDEMLAPLVTAIVDKLLRDYNQVQAEWTTPTDCDRLDEAFRLLEEQGMLARHNYGCCPNCAQAALWDEIAEQPGHVKGGIFYTVQDTEYARQSGKLFLSFDSTGTYHDTARIGRLIDWALREVGLKTDWNGKASQRICIPDFDWKRRRPHAGNDKPLVWVIVEPPQDLCL